MNPPAVPGNTNSLLMTFFDLKADLTQSLSWQTFTVSAPLQLGIWLLRCLRPLSCALAFSRPGWVEQFQSSSVQKREMIVACSCLLYAGRFLEQLPSVVSVDGTPVVPFWVRCVSHFTSWYLRRFQHRFLSSAGFTPRNMPCFDACRSPLTPLLKCGPPGQSFFSLKSAQYYVPYN